MVHFLAADASAYIACQVRGVNGGMDTYVAQRGREVNIPASA